MAFYVVIRDRFNSSHAIATTAFTPTIAHVQTRAVELAEHQLDKQEYPVLVGMVAARSPSDARRYSSVPFDRALWLFWMADGEFVDAELGVHTSSAIALKEWLRTNHTEVG